MSKIDTSALENAEPTKKIAQVRQLLPQIQEARERGLSLKEIWEKLKKGGLDMTYTTFITYLNRIMAKEGGGKTASQALPKTAPAAYSAPAKVDHGIQNEPAAAAPEEPSDDKTNQILSVAGAALEQARTTVGTKDYSKIARDRERQNKK